MGHKGTHLPILILTNIWLVNATWQQQGNASWTALHIHKGYHHLTILVITGQGKIGQFLSISECLKKIATPLDVPILKNVWLYSSEYYTIFGATLVSIGPFYVILNNIDNHHSF